MRATASVTSVAPGPNDGSVALTLLVAWTAGDGSQPAGRANVRLGGAGVDVAVHVVATAVSTTLALMLPGPGFGLVNVSVALENCYGASPALDTWIYGARGRAVAGPCSCWLACVCARVVVCVRCVLSL